MVYLPILFLAIAAIGGMTLGAVKYRGKGMTKVLAIVYGIFAATGFVILAVNVIMDHSKPYKLYKEPHHDLPSYIVFYNCGGRRHDTGDHEVSRQGYADFPRDCAWYFCSDGAGHSSGKCYHGHFKHSDEYFSGSVRSRGSGRIHRIFISYPEKTDARQIDNNTWIRSSNFIHSAFTCSI
jgi:hypothetical protein